MTYLIEFYTKSESGVAGWDIKLARTDAKSECDACCKIREQFPASFDCVITCEEVQPDFLPECECILIP